MSYDLKIENMKIEGDNKVIKELRCILTVTANTGKTEASIFSLALGEPDANNFIEFENLSETQAKEWIIDTLGQDEFDARIHGLESKIAENWVVQRTVRVPWVTANTA